MLVRHLEDLSSCIREAQCVLRGCSLQLVRTVFPVPLVVVDVDLSCLVALVVGSYELLGIGIVVIERSTEVHD